MLYFFGFVLGTIGGYMLGIHCSFGNQAKVFFGIIFTFAIIWVNSWETAIVLAMTLAIVFVGGILGLISGNIVVAAKGENGSCRKNAKRVMKSMLTPSR